MTPIRSYAILAAFAAGIIVGLFLATAANAAPRPSVAAIPAPTMGVGRPDPRRTTAAPHRPYSQDVRVADELVVHGVASWYAAPDTTAAAGPALRRALGPHWRNQWVTVTAGGRSVTVQLTDSCQCLRGTSRERLIDLSDGAFARLAPLAVGLVRVRILGRIVPPATDVAP